MIGWVRQAEDRKAHIVTETRPIMGARLEEDHTTKRERIGTTFRSLCPHDVNHFFRDGQSIDDYEWMPWLWQPTPEEACLLCWRRAARAIGCKEAP